MSRGIHFVTTHVAIFMAACMSSLGALGAWTPENKAALVAQMGTNCGTMVGPDPDRDPISTWDTSKIREMDYLFKSCSNFNEDISKWDVSKVKKFDWMFEDATTFNQPLGSWNTSKATDFKGIFHQATSFNQPLDSWNTEKATEFKYMFDGATTFNQPLGSWNTEKVTVFYYMFKDTSVSIDTTAYWDTTNARSGSYLSPQQPCPAGYDASQTYPNGDGARKGTLADRCPDGCNVASDNTACECAFGMEPAVDGLSCTDCTTKLHPDRYYATQGSCTTVSCTRAATEYFDKSAVYTADTCSVATCAKGTKPAADGLSCEDETKSKVSETGDDAMIGTIMISETGDDAMIGTIMIVGSVIGALVLLAVVGIVVFCVIKPKRNIKPKRKNNRRDLGNRESKFDVELSYE